MNLSELKNGEDAIIVKLDFDDKKIKRHLLDMGLTKNTIVKMKLNTDNGVIVVLREADLGIGKSDASKIKVKTLNNKY